MHDLAGPVSRRSLLVEAARWTAVSSGLALLAGCGLGQTTSASQPDMVRIGYLSPGFPSPELDILRQSLRDLGYVEGRDIAFDFRFAAGQDTRLKALATELKEQRKANILVVLGGVAASAAKEISGGLPVIFVRVGDPVGTGLVDSLAKPGGNLTGLTSFSPQLIGKRLEILKTAVPGISSVLALWDAGHPIDEERQAAENAASVFGIKLFSVAVPGTTQFDDAIASAHDFAPDGLIDFIEDVTFNQRRRILGFAVKSKLPALYPIREFVDDGGMLSYGPTVDEQFRRAAVYVDKIVKGAKPGELPIEQPIRFEMVINAKTADSLGVSLSDAVLTQSDEVVR